MVKQSKRRAVGVSRPVIRRSHIASRFSAGSLCPSKVPGGLRLPLALLVVFALLALHAPVLTRAQDETPPIREIFVPFEDLNVILENDKQRVFLTRAEYEALVKEAKSKPQTPAPHKVVLTDAQYTGELQEGRALIRGSLQIEVLEGGLFGLPLELAGAGIRSATLDGKPAPLSRDEANRPLLLIQGQGLRQLELQLIAPLQSAAASQTLQITLPTNAAARLKLTVPGNVEVKAGGAVVSRTYDMAANRTELELLPQRGGMALAMSLNNRLTQDQQVVVARSVIVDEITQGYERIHATLSFRPLHGAVEKLRIAIPAGFEVTAVNSHLLARWEETADDAGAKTLEATLREPTTEQIVLQLTANRSPAAGADWLAGLAEWKFPKLEPLDVAGHVAVLGVLVEDRLKPEKFTATDLLPIDSAALSGAIPASVLNAEPGAPSVRQVATYYAPSAQYDLSASFARPPAGLKVAGNSLLVIGDRQLTLQGGFALSPEAESIFAFAFTIPAGWQVTQVTAADGSPLPVERYAVDGGGTRLSVKLAQGIRVGQTQTVNYQAIQTPAGWLADWTTQKLAFPQVLVEDATADTGAIAAQTTDDLEVRPDSLSGLTPLLDNEKGTFGLGEIPTALAYRYESRDFALGLVVERTQPSLTAQAFSFFKLERENLIAHYELAYEIRAARTRTLVFSLDKSTPAEITIRGLGDAVVKEYEHNDDGAWRRWTVQLAERHSGTVRLAVDFQQQYDELALSRFGVPLIEAEEVEYQSALFAVEGDAELDVEVKTTARAVDPGELAAAEYVIGKRLIGAFGYTGRRPSVSVRVKRRETHPLPPAVVQRAELVTKVAAGARLLEDNKTYAALAQSVARYDLLTKATLLEIQLPPSSKLWSIYLNDQPTKPQREGESLLVSLPAQEHLSVRKLQIVYESASQPLGLDGTIRAAAPKLLVRAAGSDEEREIPQADLQWQLLLPAGYEVRRVGGTVATDDIPPRHMAAVTVAAVLYEVAGGIQPWWNHDFRSPTVSVTGGAAMYEYDGSESMSEGATTTAEGYFQESATPPPMAAEPAMDPAAEMPKTANEFDSQPPADMPAQLDQAPQRDSRAREEAERNSALKREAAMEEMEAAQAEVRELDRAKDELAAVKLKAAEGKFWALQGVSSLKIDIQADEQPAATFHSLGEEPRLVAGVVDARRVRAAAWGMGLLILLVGVGLTFRPTRDKAAFVIVVLVAASVPLLLTTALDEVGVVFDGVFFAGCALIAYYLIASVVLGIVRWLRSRLPADCCRPPAVAQQIVAILIAAALLAITNTVLAQQPPDESTIPVAIPADAIIIPYDSEQPIGEAAGGKLLVPYPKYVELWNLAYPEKRIDATPPPREFAIAGTAYEATLGSGDFLSLTGKLEIEVYTDKPLTVPLVLAGGVLERATVDGQAARLQVVEPAAPATEPNQQANAAPALPPRMLLLHLSGKGRKVVQLNLRLGLERQGGWRIVRSHLPVGPAAALTLTVPQAGTEIRQTSLADKPAFETTADNEKIETALGEGGIFDLQWRPKVGEGQVDQALTAKSTALFDVREDALRLVWQTQLEFGRGTRESFTLSAPADYLVEQVLGDNIRGWTTKIEADRQRIEVTLLKAATGSETLTLHLAKRGRVGEGDMEEFDAPAILIEGAALEQGEIAVRKSPRLDLRTIGAVGLSRADNEGQTQALEQLADAADAAVLVVTPYQSFRFVKPPFRLTLAASVLPQNATAQIRAALQVAQRGTTLDAAITFRPQGQPLYQVRIALPEGFTVERVGPGDLEWSVTADNGRQILTVQLLDGATGEFTLTLFGKIEAPKPEPKEADEDGAAATQKVEADTGKEPVPPNEAAPKPRSVPLPKLEVLDVDKQEGEIVIVPDPDVDVRIENLKAADASPLTGGPGWMESEQQTKAKAIVRYRTPIYSGTVVLTPRQPLVSARSITNVKITPQAIEETIVLDFRIEQAGIRSVSFLLPDRLAKARIDALLVQRKIVEPATDANGQRLAGWVRVRLILQDYVEGEYRVGLEHDRLLSADKQMVSLPVIETGRTDQRLVAIENAGRDEIVIDANDIVGLEPLSNQQQAWRDLAAILGDNITQAYAAVASQSRPELTFQTRERQRVDDVGARIGLATTIMVVDEAGTYRALQEYRVTNATLQFLEVELPAGARLWTATVAGEPVKPAEAVPPVDRVVRIPLVKTAAGEGDYAVQLKYGGRMPRPGLFTAVEFPFIKTRNINVELSQVRLWLPESREWFGFFGTLRQVPDENELAQGFQGYLNKRIQEATEALSSGDDYTKVRALVNLKQSRLMLENNRAQAENDLKQLGIGLHDYHDIHEANENLLDQAEQQVQEDLAQQQRGEEVDNRGRLNQYWGKQELKRSKNVVSELGSNFDAVNGVDAAGTQPMQGKGQGLNEKWFDQNKLRTDGEQQQAQTEGQPEAKPNAAFEMSPGQSDGGRFFRGGKPGADDAIRFGDAIDQSGGGKKAPQIAGKEQLDQLQKQLQDEEKSGEQTRGLAGERSDNVQRYQERLEQGAREGESLGLYGQSAGRQPQMQPPGTPTSGSGTAGGGMGGIADAQSFRRAPNAPAAGPTVAATPQTMDPFGVPDATTAAAPALPAPVLSNGQSVAELTEGLASLDVTLPERGRLYRFTTPRGEIEIEARSISHVVLRKLAGLAAVLVAIGVVWLLGREPSRRVWRTLFRSLAFGIVLILLGLTSVISGLLPFAGLLVIVIGLVLSIRAAWRRDARSATATAL